jgi:hypothetical protein
VRELFATPGPATGDLAHAVLADLDTEALAALADLLAPHLLERIDPAQRELTQLLTCAQAGSRTGTHVETVRRAVRSGALEAAGWVGRSPRITPMALATWLTCERRVKGGQPDRRRPRRDAATRNATRRPMTSALARLMDRR